MNPVEPWRFSELIITSRVASRWEDASDPLITSVVEDSRQVSPGACFVARAGSRSDGHRYVQDAIKAGAGAVIHERPLTLPPGVAGLRVDSARGVVGRLASTLYGVSRLQREGRLQVVGVTGTNGKSTFCFLARAILRQAGHPTALLGTIQYDLLSRQIDASLTTPAPADLMSYLREAAGAGATHAVMEVSSIALDQGRCDGIRFAVAVFSNLTGDHLDYHGDMVNYLAAKKRLFDGLEPGAVAVVNGDDPAADQIVADCEARVIRYSILPAGRSAPERPHIAGRAPFIDLSARVQAYTAEGTRFELIMTRPVDSAQPQSETCVIESPLVGRHNVQNSLAAAGAAVGLGVPLQSVAEGLRSVSSVPGRLQRVSARSADGAEPGFSVLVDYAHTDDALANALSALRPLAGGRLIVLFGCGGDRDATKRPRMARVAARHADQIIVTSDNPRSEDPELIIREIMAGFAPGDLNRVTSEPDRRRAIGLAVGMAEPGDVLLLAGKGHETYQLVGKERLEFDDAAVAAEFLSARRGASR